MRGPFSLHPWVFTPFVVIWCFQFKNLLAYNGSKVTSHCCINLHFPTIINLNNFAVWMSSFLNPLFIIFCLFFWVAFFWAISNDLFILQTLIFGLSCILYSTPNLLFFSTNFFVALFFGPQMYKDAYVVYCLFSTSFCFPVSVCKVFVNLGIIGLGKEAPEPLREKDLH